MARFPRLAAPAPRTVAVALLIALAAAAAYARVPGLGLVFDDRSFITQNKRVLAGLSLDGVVWAFTSTYHANWQPLTWVSCMLDVSLFGKAPAGFHAVNLALHAANALLVLAALRLATGAFWRPALAAALFALHPLNVETVAWVTERSAVLGTFFGLLAVIAHVRRARRPGPAGAAAVALLLALSLLSKPLFVTLPFLLLLLDAWPLGRAWGGPGRGAPPARLIAEKLPLLALSAAAAGATLYAQRSWGAVQGLDVVPVAARLANAVLAYGRYLLKGLWPAGLAVFYPLQLPVPPLPVLAAAAALLAASAGALAALRRAPWLAAGWAWYLGALVPMIGIVQAGGQSMADRYAYLPFLGLFAALAWSLAAATPPAPAARTAVAAACVAALGALAAFTWQQTSHWRDDVTLFTRAAAVTRDNALAHFNLGVELTTRGDLAPAKRHLIQAVHIRPGYAEARGNLGGVLLQEGDVDGALEQYREALRLRPDLAELRVNLGAILARLGRGAEAEQQYREALRTDPKQVTAHMNLGNLLSDTGRAEEALQHYREALRLDPEDARVHFNLGVTLGTERRYAEAAAAYREALRLDPAHLQARQNLLLLPAPFRSMIPRP